MVWALLGIFLFGSRLFKALRRAFFTPKVFHAFFRAGLSTVPRKTRSIAFAPPCSAPATASPPLQSLTRQAAKMKIKFLPVFLLPLLFLLQAFPSFSESNSAAPEAPDTKEQNASVKILSSADFPKLTSIKYTPPKGDEKIKLSNELFSKYQKDIEKQAMLKRIPESRRSEKDFPSAEFYAYEVRSSDDEYLSTFNGLAARLQISQGTLATVNSISSPHVKDGALLILPVNQGLFIAKEPKTPFEILLKNEFQSAISDGKNGTPRFIIDGKEFYFLEDKNFSPTDIAFFRDEGMQLPLDKEILTSPFGYRTSPISGKWTFHAGIDLAAPVGTEVHACKTGIVLETGFNSIYGNYVSIMHNGKKTSLYAHLSKILVQKNESVSTGQAIGLVGTTGASTGPHLHFEIRENGTPEDPSALLKKQ